MIESIKTYIIALIVFFAIDLVWLGLISKNLYINEIGFIMSDKPNWLVAIIFYLLFIMGLVFFAINPAVKNDSWTYALFVGMFFGLITYATYDLTNLATLKDWPLKVTIIDLIWGSSICGMVSTITFFALKLFKS